MGFMCKCALEPLPVEIVVVEVTVLREVEEELVIILGVRFLILVERERMLRRLEAGPGRVGLIVTSSRSELFAEKLPRELLPLRLRDPIAESKEVGLIGVWGALADGEVGLEVEFGVLKGCGSQSCSLPCSFTGET